MNFSKRMHMDSLLNDSCRVAFAGLIYNLDTLFQRANLKGESPADALRSILGRAPVLEGETAPFSPQGSDEANGETPEKVVTHLQRPETFLQSVVATEGACRRVLSVSSMTTRERAPRRRTLCARGCALFSKRFRLVSQAEHFPPMR